LFYGRVEEGLSKSREKTKEHANAMKNEDLVVNMMAKWDYFVGGEEG
jgi:hypothetical protein